MYSPLASPKKTIEVLTEHGLYTKKRLGQHFLIDDNTIGHIIALAKLQPSDRVLEIGPGIGVLSYALLDAVDHLFALEFDPDMVRVLEASLKPEAESRKKEFILLQVDAAKEKDETRDRMLLQFAPTALVANLPYQVAASVVLKYFQELPSLKSATVMVQTEVAERMAALPNTKSYGAYTAKLQLYARAAGSFKVSKQSFLPPPRVESTVIRLERNDALARSLDHKLEDITALIDAAFAQRRKTITNSIRSTFSISRDILDEAFLLADISPSLRAENLDIESFIRLSKTIKNLQNRA